VGKDSVMQAVAEQRPGTVLVRRVITRQADAGGEDFEPVTLSEFLSREASGEFLLSWAAHGLHYGIPDSVADDLAQGRDALVNLSRSVLPQAQARFAGFRTILLTAPVTVLAARLAARGRESAEDIARRLARAGFALPPGVQADVVENAGPLSEAVAEVLALIEETQVQ
jgi:ribose 1,5-bisphosphokinase